MSRLKDVFNKTKNFLMSKTLWAIGIAVLAHAFQPDSGFLKVALDVIFYIAAFGAVLGRLLAEKKISFLFKVE